MMEGIVYKLKTMDLEWVSLSSWRFLFFSFLLLSQGLTFITVPSHSVPRGRGSQVFLHSISHLPSHSHLHLISNYINIFYYTYIIQEKIYSVFWEEWKLIQIRSGVNNEIIQHFFLIFYFLQFEFHMLRPQTPTFEATHIHSKNIWTEPNLI